MADDEIGSYEISAMPGGVDVELVRLREQALQWWAQEERLLSALGLKDGMAVLEPGAGPGFITEQFLRLLPHSEITVVERDPVMVAQAQRYLADKGIERVRFVTASVLETGLPADSYDFAYARLIFQHLPRPVDAARELWRVLKPGGRRRLPTVKTGWRSPTRLRPRQPWSCKRSWLPTRRRGAAITISGGSCRASSKRPGSFTSPSTPCCNTATSSAWKRSRPSRRPAISTRMSSAG